MANPVAMAVGNLVVRNREEPAPKRSCASPILEAMQAGVGIDEDLAGGVLRVITIAQPDAAIAQDWGPIASEERGEVVRITSGGNHEDSVVPTGPQSNPSRLVLG